jgi:hypothetical protein
VSAVVGSFRVGAINGFATGQTTLIATDSGELKASKGGGRKSIIYVEPAYTFAIMFAFIGGYP